MRSAIATVFALCVAACNAIAGYAPAYPDTCDDGKLDGDESAVDCGGETCPVRCPNYLACRDDSDCESDACNEGSCVPAECNNGTLDQDETDVDCGGMSCNGCDDGRRCKTGTDCSNGVCANHECSSIEQSCGDGKYEDGETDVDCGGRCVEVGKLCAAGYECNTDSDCKSGRCSSDFTCE